MLPSECQAANVFARVGPCHADITRLIFTLLLRGRCIVQSHVTKIIANPSWVGHDTTMLISGRAPLLCSARYTNKAARTSTHARLVDDMGRQRDTSPRLVLLGFSFVVCFSDLLRALRIAFRSVRLASALRSASLIVPRVLTTSRVSRWWIVAAPCR